ncbi:MAG: capsular polysaccharide synthesis protein [Colwellia sp.]|jgi:Capsular polysaccharide synthesis protein.
MKIAGQNNIFLFWNEGAGEIPVVHRMNIENIKNRLKDTEWNVVVTSLNKNDEFYIENLIDLPSYFFSLDKSIGDTKFLGGNQSDIVRLRLLEKFGGVYFDTSTILLKENINDILLYRRFIHEGASLAAYTNFTFTRKNCDKGNFFTEAKDGIELGVLYAKKNSRILRVFNQEIDSYWRWKTKNKPYTEYPLFIKYNLTKVSFLNQYHIHYSIFHLIVTRDTSLLNELVVQSMHMKGKEDSDIDGPYSITDRFCRDDDGYGRAQPKKLLEAFTEGDVLTNTGENTSLGDRVNLFSKMDLIVIPGYMRVDIEDKFKTVEDFSNVISCYNCFYKKT